LLQKLEKKLLPVKPKIKPPRNEISSRIPPTQPRLQKSENAKKKKKKTLFVKRNMASRSFGTSTVGCQSITATKINHEIAEKQ
jgi:hypothetical protein